MSTQPEARCPVCHDALRKEMRRMLRDAGPWRELGSMAAPAALIEDRLPVVTEDLHALAAGDPSARGSCLYVLRSYACFQAVLAYRLAHAIHGARWASRDAARTFARRLSEQAKLASRVEIHPAAEIGRRFVVDHGSETVIGETACLGADCYILQGVVLGSYGIAANRGGKRHPTLGNGVEVGAFARVLGPIHVGDGVLIGPHAVVCSDVPAHTRVVIRNQWQVASPGCTLEIYGLVPSAGGVFDLHGCGLRNVGLNLVDEDLTPLSLTVEVLERTEHRLCFRIAAAAPVLERDVGIMLRDPSGHSLTLMRCDLRRFLEYGDMTLAMAG
jgi:serine O-acetyltransferase